MASRVHRQASAWQGQNPKIWSQTDPDAGMEKDQRLVSLPSPLTLAMNVHQPQPPALRTMPENSTLGISSREVSRSLSCLHSSAQSLEIPFSGDLRRATEMPVGASPC